MIAKLGFTLIVALFGALMFAGGMLSPGAWQQSVTGLTRQLEQIVGEFIGKKNTAPVANAPATAKSPVSAAPSSSAAPAASVPKAAKDDAIPAESLLIPTPLPDKGAYAVQVGQFTDASQANAVGSRIKALNLPFDKVIEVVDQSGNRWSIVPVGPYANLDDARTARIAVARALQLSDALPLIVLPPEKPKQ